MSKVLDANGQPRDIDNVLAIELIKLRTRKVIPKLDREEVARIACNTFYANLDVWSHLPNDLKANWLQSADAVIALVKGKQ